MDDVEVIATRYQYGKFWQYLQPEASLHTNNIIHLRQECVRHGCTRLKTRRIVKGFSIRPTRLSCLRDDLLQLDNNVTACIYNSLIEPSVRTSKRIPALLGCILSGVWRQFY